jgi:hypothetical protein
MEDVVGIVKAFHADIYGPHVRDLYAEKDPGNKTSLDVRIDEHLFSYFLGVLGVFYNVTVRILHTTGVSIGMRPKGAGETEQDIDMNITWCNALRWNSVPTELIDVNLLVSNGTAIFVRPDAVLSFTAMSNKIDHVMKRVRSHRFGLMRLPTFPPTSVLKTLNKCHDLVRAGWVMDDAYIGKSSAVINTWKSFSTQSVRNALTPQEKESMVSQDQCSLCHDAFQDDDIVLNTCCNHNFHWVCHSDDRATRMSGISSWFHLKRDFACPFCRQAAVAFLA